MPPHNGHVYLIEFARNYVEQLTVVVCSLKREPIPGELRYRWVSELFPDVNVVHLTDEIPQEPSEHPDFWQIWHDSLMRVLPGRPDYVFASEDYGAKLAETLGAEFVPVDRDRTVVPVSGSAIRNDPFKHWQYIPRCVRPYYVRRVCIFGPESTGKSTLAKDLAAHFETVCVPEYARELLEGQGGQIAYEDIEGIARGQLASEEALARHANRVLFCDTDLLTTLIWSERLFGRCPPWVSAAAARHTYDLYLLTDIDVPWIADTVRYLPDEREQFFQRCRAELERRQRVYVRVSGNWQERFQRAQTAVEKILQKN